MVKKSGKHGGGSKERIIPPSKSLLSREARKLQDGDPAAARIMAAASVAKREHVKRPRGK